MAFEFIAEQLAQRKQQQLYRRKQVHSSAQGREITFKKQTYLNFSSNDYLGLANHPEVVKAWQRAADDYGVGSGGSPLVTGYQKPHYELEQNLCEWLGWPAVLLFNSGFSANQAVIKSLMAKDDLLLQDKLNHASLLEAGSLVAAQQRRFAHNNVAQLSKLLAKSATNKLVITEGVFSMDGDQAPLVDLAHCCHQHQAWLYVDDAHGAGVLGRQGKGSVAAAGLSAQQVQINMLTFGKALGVGGAAVMASQALIDYLLNFSRSYVYSTAMPAAQAAAVSAAIMLVQKQEQHQARLQANIALFKALMVDNDLNLAPSQTAIQPLIVGSSERSLAYSQALKKRGFWVGAIRPPTVPVGSARLRITLTSSHTQNDIQRLVAALAEIIKCDEGGGGDEI